MTLVRESPDLKVEIYATVRVLDSVTGTKLFLKLPIGTISPSVYFLYVAPIAEPNTNILSTKLLLKPKTSEAFSKRSPGSTRTPFCMRMVVISGKWFLSWKNAGKLSMKVMTSFGLTIWIYLSA